MAVAIRTITRLQDANDAPVLGAGQDGYVLTWDNASSAFVAEAMSAGVTDHGALTGLSDDDHTQYVLLTGRAGGQTLYGGNAANDDITIYGTSHSTRTSSYVILQPMAGFVGIGTTTPGTLLALRNNDATDSGIYELLSLTKDVLSSGVGTNNLGVAIALQAESSTDISQRQARIFSSWYEATHASRKADLVLTAYDTAEREGVRIRGAGSAPAIGFLGATPAGRIAHVADASTTHAITDPGDSPADADALRDDLVTNVIPTIETALNNLGTKINTLFTMAETFGFHATS